MALISTFFDNFDDNSLDTTKWASPPGNYTGGGSTSCSIAETNNQVEITLPNNEAANGGVNFIGYDTFGSRDMTSDGVFVKVTDWPLMLSGTEGGLHVWNTAGAGILKIKLSGEDTPEYSIKFLYDIGGGEVVMGTQINTTTPWDQHSWFRIRESGGTTFMDSAPRSADDPPTAAQWVNRGSVANPFVVTSVKATLFGGCWKARANPGKFAYDGFNMATTPAAPPPPNLFLTHIAC